VNIPARRQGHSAVPQSQEVVTASEASPIGDGPAISAIKPVGDLTTTRFRVLRKAYSASLGFSKFESDLKS